MDKRKCCVCVSVKPIIDFHFRKNGKPYSYCITCHRNYVKTHYLKNKPAYILKAKKHNAFYRKKCDDYIRSLFCSECGFSFQEHPYVCDFHHPVKNKEFNVARIKTGSFIRFMKEVRKCIPLCSNCHRIKHNFKK